MILIFIKNNFFSQNSYNFSIVKYIGICDEFVPLVLENSSSALKIYIFN